MSKSLLDQCILLVYYWYIKCICTKTQLKNGVNIKKYIIIIANNLSHTNLVLKFRSFPSGHTSFAFASGTWCALYSYYWFGKISTNMNIGRPAINFPGNSFRISFLFLWFLPAICIAITRTTDYRHHTGDVLGGAALGTVITFFTFIQYYGKS